MAAPTQFRQYLIAQDAQGNNIEVLRTGEQVGVLAFDVKRLLFVHCHVLLETLKSRRSFDDRARKFKQSGNPRLARLLESGEDEGSTFYITANVDGETLRNYLSRHEQLPVWLAMRLTTLSIQAVRALLSVGDFLPMQLLDTLRVVQTGPQDLTVMMADYRLVDAEGAKSAKARIMKAAFDKQEQFLGVFFLERLQTGASMQEATLNAADFTELLGNLLGSCGQGMEEGMVSVLRTLAKTTPTPPPGELAAPLKPRPQLAPLLTGFADVARGVSSQVRIQSQKLDASQPYAMRGTFTKTGQDVVVEQLPPARMTGPAPEEALRQVLHLPKIGKFPNIVPVVFLEKTDGLLCAVETAVVGMALSDILTARETLDPQETYLVLAGMDAALGQLEKTTVPTRRLRLEDIFLFTGFGKAPQNDTDLLAQKLNMWPGFSVVLRAHPCLSSMSGRGTDPAMLLPPDAKTKPEAEPIWNGAWMAALGCFLSGMTSGEAAKHTTGVAEQDATFRMLEDELARGRKGTPSNRPEFLARFARVMQDHDLAHPQEAGGFWAELSGSGAAQGRAAEIARAAATQPVGKKTGAQGVKAPMPVRETPPEPEDPVIGFAEALIQRSQPAEEPPVKGGGLQAMRAGLRMPPVDDVESSWRPMHEATPLWLRGLKFIGGSVLLGAALAHLSGRAIWQAPQPPPPPRALSEEVKEDDHDFIELPSAPVSTPSAQAPTAPKPTTPTLTPPASLLAAVDLESRPAAIGSTPAAAPSPMASAPTATPPPVVDANLSAKLLELRKTGGKLPADLRTATDKAARGGSTEAMLALGRMHLRGENGAVDERSAFTWFEKAMNAGDTAAAVPLAECYLQGWGTAPDQTLAVDLLKRAADSGDPAAKDQLGVCHARGIGVARDDAKAFLLCSEAYNAGSVTACGNLGALYLRGQGVPQDAERAVLLFSEGARRGHADSMLLYAQSLEYGTGTPANRDQAAQWYQQAARLGNAEAANWCRGKGIAY